MKLLFLIRSLNYGGTERQLLTLAKGLQKKGHDIRVAVFYPSGPFQKELEIAGIPIISLNKKDRWNIVSFLWHLWIVMKAVKPDILHSYLCMPNILSVFIKFIFSKIKIVWGIRASKMDLNQYDWLVRLSYRLECYLSHFTDLIIVNSYAGESHAIKNNFPANRIIVISNGIDTERFLFNPDSGKHLRIEWGIKKNEKLIGLVARLDPMKDYTTFLRAAALIAKDMDDVKFVCLGDGSENYRKKIQALTQSLDLNSRFIWVNKIFDMTSFYNTLNILVLTSSYGEGFSNVIGEAMACGIPCVVTDVGDNARVVSNLGIVVEPNNPNALAYSISKTLINIPKNNPDLLREHIIKNYNTQILIDMTEKVLFNLIKSR